MTDDLAIDLQVIEVDEDVFCPDCLDWSATRLHYVFVEPVNIEVQGQGWLTFCNDCDFEGVDDG